MVCIKVEAKFCSKLLNLVKGYKLEKYKLISEGTKRVIHLNNTIKHTDLREIPEETRQAINEIEGIQILPTTLHLGYEELTAELVTSFETVGHIARFNLSPECEPFKKIIGKVIMDKNKHIRTVVNKTANINNEFRTFQMEVIAGEPNFLTEVKDNGCRYVFDYTEVYWNSRLSKEHDRLVSLFKKNDIIVDMFAGVGPFAIPAARAGCIVYSNDLNPRSHHYLKENAVLNKCDKNVKAFNLDGRLFIKELLFGETKLNRIDHIIMNLPASAIEFLDVFRDLRLPDRSLTPTIHCYGFSNETDITKDAIEQGQKILGPIENATVFEVRGVSPKKTMFRLSFPYEIKREEESEVVEPPHKKQKTEL
uniref:tRNA (guanine(37)-N1)-methyltransferase n=1 Tax=Arcella intermedia TaxID=1963864 RepID=A0A6B2L725_9EUKA